MTATATLAHLATGLDLDQWSGRVTLAARLARQNDVDSLRAIARDLTPGQNPATTADRLAMLIADAWQRHHAAAQAIQ